MVLKMFFWGGTYFCWGVQLCSPHIKNKISLSATLSLNLLIKKYYTKCKGRTLPNTVSTLVPETDKPQLHVLLVFVCTICTARQINKTNAKLMIAGAKSSNLTFLCMCILCIWRNYITYKWYSSTIYMVVLIYFKGHQ